MAFQSTTLTSSLASVYTSSGNNVVTTVYWCNRSDSTDATVNVHVVSNGGTASSDNVIYKELNITAGDTYVMDMEKLFFSNGDFMSAVTNAGGDGNVVCTVNSTGV